MFFAVARRYKVNLVVLLLKWTGSSKDDFKAFLHRFGCPLLLNNWTQPKIPRCRQVRRVLYRVVIQSGLVLLFPKGHFALIGVLMCAILGNRNVR
jgi:hypothetical protein